jgi:flagellar hook-associated protein 1 FlgK
MTDLLSTGISGLLASQLALNTTGHNISNVNTAGYSRQQVMLGARTPDRLGTSYVGTGVNVEGVRRLYDSFLTGQVRDATGAQSRLQTFSDLASQVDNLLSDPNAGLQPALDSFFGAMHDLASNPADSTTRQALLGQASSLAGRLRTLGTQLTSLDKQADQQIGDEVTQINTLTQGIANVNLAIQRSGGNPSNDLLDQRDELVRQLSTHVGVNVIPQDGNMINVTTGNGQPLVLSTSAQQLTTVTNAYDPSRHDVATSNGTVITTQLSGGALGGILDFRKNMLDPARNALGRTTVALTDAVNAQHHAGMDLNGQLGGDFFNTGAPQTFGNRNNAGTAQISAAFGDVSQLTTSDYTMRYDGSNWTLSRADGTQVAMTGTGTAADPFVADGLEFTVSGSASAGDSFLIKPTATAAAATSVAITDIRQIAAASPVAATAAGSNTGTGAVGGISVTDATDPNLMSPASITFTSPTTYQINGSGSYTFTPGQPIAANGWSLNLTGAPQAGDTFNVAQNTNGVGDNTNALAMANIADLGVLDGGNSTLTDAYAQLVGTVGTNTQQAQNGLTAQTALLNQSIAAQQNVSGVNLDEEAANLVRYQQSYQAAAQVISVASTLFDSVLAAMQGS